MRIERLGIEHKDLLFPRFKETNTGISEYTFANLYLFRENHEYEVIVDDRGVFVRGKSYDGHVYLMPTADVRGLEISYLADMMREAEFLFPVPQEWLAVFNPERFEIQFNEGDADYIYTVEKMSTYKGRHLHKKRNLLKQFQEAYTHDARPLTSDRLDEARFILKDWLTTSTSDEGETDYGPCLEALDRYEELVLCGGIYYADNEPAGFVLGEELSPETFVLHFAKARTKFKGVYQYLFNNFAGILPPHYKYLNLEQDLEKENLRVFKSSYMPDAMVPKARVRLKS
jgi:hypothetical protein